MSSNGRLYNIGYTPELGMPYMGSKRKLAKKIVDEIIESNPNTKYIYDLFGGGGAISFEFLQRPKISRVIYNELNTGVTELLKKIQKEGVTDEFYEFVDRDTFIKYKDKDCWYGGLCKVIWSFGNNQKDYLFGRDAEVIKHLGHKVCVDKCRESLGELSDIVGIELSDHLLTMDKTKARQRLSRIAIKEKLQQLERLQQLQQLEQLERLQQLESLETLQKLQKLERLEQLEHLEIFNHSYKDVHISTPIDETIIYLDPPYEDTEEYQKGGFCHRGLEEFIAQSPYKIYVSSYKFNLPKVASFKHRASLSAVCNNEVTENLYCNQEHKNYTRLF